MITWAYSQSLQAYTFCLVYNHNSTAINFLEWTMASAPTGPATNLASGTGYSYHDHPSISQWVGNPIVSWNFVMGVVNPGLIKRRIGGNWSSAYLVNVQSAAGINPACTENAGTTEAVIAWNNTFGSSQFVRLINQTYSSILNLPSSGTIALSDGATLANIKAMNFNTGSSPYSLNPLSYNFNTLSKTTLNDSICYERIAVVSAGGAEYSFYLGDIRVNGENVLSEDADDFKKPQSIKELNEILKTESFSLDDESVLNFNSFYDAIKTDSVSNLFDELKSIEFKAELISEEKNEPVVEFTSVSFKKDNIQSGDKASYEIDCSGLKPGNYFMRITAATDLDAEFSIVDVQSDNSTSMMKQAKQIKSAVSAIVIKDYALYQNYPNPFNPNTTITYQLPGEGHVTLKVYDALGNEITTLVNEVKTSGRYIVNFDASSLASGVYFYRISSNDFTSTKKLILMK